MKYDWKKTEKDIYLPKAKLSEVLVPKHKVLSMSGTGELFSEEFYVKVDILKSLSKDIHTMPKRGFYPGGYFEYTIYPIECQINEDSNIYTIMIKQPDFVTEAVARMTIISLSREVEKSLMDQVNYKSIGEYKGVQMLSVGNHDTDDELLESGYNRTDSIRHEIYLNDLRKVGIEKFKKVVRYKVI